MLLGGAISPPAVGTSSETQFQIVHSLSYLEIQATRLCELVLPFSVEEEDKSVQLHLLPFAEKK